MGCAAHPEKPPDSMSAAEKRPQLPGIDKCTETSQLKTVTKRRQSVSPPPQPSKTWEERKMRYEIGMKSHCTCQKRFSHFTISYLVTSHRIISHRIIQVALGGGLVQRTWFNMFRFNGLHATRVPQKGGFSCCVAIPNVFKAMQVQATLQLL